MEGLTASVLTSGHTGIWLGHSADAKDGVGGRTYKDQLSQVPPRFFITECDPCLAVPAYRKHDVQQYRELLSRDTS